MWLAAFLLLCLGVAPVPAAAVLDLQRDRLSAPCRLRLEQAHRGFKLWCARQGTPLRFLAQDVEKINEALIVYLQWLFAGWDSLTTWKLSRPILSRTPMPFTLLVALTRLAVLAGLSWELAFGVPAA